MEQNIRFSLLHFFFIFSEFRSFELQYCIHEVWWRGLEGSYSSRYLLNRVKAADIYFISPRSFPFTHKMVSSTEWITFVAQKPTMATATYFREQMKITAFSMFRPVTIYSQDLLLFMSRYMFHQWCKIARSFIPWGEHHDPFEPWS